MSENSKLIFVRVTAEVILESAFRRLGNEFLRGNVLRLSPRYTTECFGQQTRFGSPGCYLIKLESVRQLPAGVLADDRSVVAKPSVVMFRAAIHLGDLRN